VYVGADADPGCLGHEPIMPHRQSGLPGCANMVV